MTPAEMTAEQVMALHGPELDRLAALSLGWTETEPDAFADAGGRLYVVGRIIPPRWNPSEDWRDAGRVIEAFRLMLTPIRGGGGWQAWAAGAFEAGEGSISIDAETPQLAACRCAVEVARRRAERAATE